MIRDMMPHFDLYQPDSLEAALDLAARLGEDGWLLGAGQDSYDWFKNRTKRPRAVIDLSGIESLRTSSTRMSPTWMLSLGWQQAWDASPKTAGPT